MCQNCRLKEQSYRVACAPGVGIHFCVIDLNGYNKVKRVLISHKEKHLLIYQNQLENESESDATSRRGYK